MYICSLPRKYLVTELLWPQDEPELGLDTVDPVVLVLGHVEPIFGTLLNFLGVTSFTLCGEQRSFFLLPLYGSVLGSLGLLNVT